MCIHYEFLNLNIDYNDENTMNTLNTVEIRDKCFYLLEAGILLILGVGGNVGHLSSTDKCV